MMAGEYVVPAVLRGDPMRFVPRQASGRREPARVTAGAFRAAGLPVPDEPGRRNAYQLSGRQGWPWSPALDRHISRHDGELLGHGHVVLLDVDVPMAVDGTPMADTLRWLSDRAVEAGELLDVSATVAVRTPGHPGSGHLPGWHLWYRAPTEAVRMGPLARCRYVELRGRGTCPGSAGYLVMHAPGELPMLPQWIAALAGRPRVLVPRAAQGSVSPGSAWKRLHGVLDCVLGAERGERNRMLYWGALRAGELVASGAIDAAAAEQSLRDAAADLGLIHEDGDRAVLATIRSGFERAGVTCAAH